MEKISLLLKTLGRFIQYNFLSRGLHDREISFPA